MFLPPFPPFLYNHPGPRALLVPILKRSETQGSIVICQRSRRSSGLELAQKPAPVVVDQGPLHCSMLPPAVLLCVKIVLDPDTVLIGMDRAG